MKRDVQNLNVSYEEFLQVPGAYEQLVLVNEASVPVVDVAGR